MWAVRLTLVFAAAAAILTSGTVRCGAQPPAGSQSSAQVREHAKKILQRPEFRTDVPDSPLAKFFRDLRERWDRFGRWIARQWDHFRRWLDRSFEGPRASHVPGLVNGLPVVFAGLLIVAGIALVGWLLVKLVAAVVANRRAKKAKSRTAYDTAEEDDNLVLEPGVWMDQAATYATSDDYRRAFRAVFVAT
ncbi:MAG TPA: hypothetical protein VKT77_15485, partial [Chthonomonadaceae bacterium]|nr:hypothetical protein [Chthonomonadaceae bacterium]